MPFSQTVRTQKTIKISNRIPFRDESLASPISLNPFATTSARDSISTLDSSRSVPDQLAVHLFGGPVQQSSKVKGNSKPKNL
ncbi:hypothetical protein DY000_02050006 [Brassica cretica]|uniref:Uncharacterized protein n=1 Tax=Brassica cretica TaxID=69181 RepID=A0ABQ7F1N9_BRACR|nr:hypothetical protein DY000_02050006 [Brassica cretica]